MRVEEFAFEPPPGWEAQTNVMLREPPGQMGEFRLNIQVGYRAAHPGLTLGVVGETQKKILTRDLPNATITRQGLEQVGDRQIYRLAYGFVVEGNPMQQIQLHCAVGDQLVTLTGTATEARIEDLAQKMEELLTTLGPATI